MAIVRGYKSSQRSCPLSITHNSLASPSHPHDSRPIMPAQLSTGASNIVIDGSDVDMAARPPGAMVRGCVVSKRPPGAMVRGCVVSKRPPGAMVRGCVISYSD